MEAEVELRCNQPHQVLLGKMRLTGERPKVGDGNLIELVCDQCRKDLRAQGDGTVVRVLHRFNFAGEFVETEVVRRRAAASAGADTSGQRVSKPLTELRKE